MRLFVTRELAIDPRAIAGEDIEVEVFAESRAPTREELVARACGASGLVTLLSDRIDGPLLDALGGSVRVVANHAVGYDNVDVPACTERGVWVTNTPDVLTEATADLTWALILAVARRLREGERMVRDGKFGGWSPTMLLGMELGGKTLGIFGYGRIGRAVARRGEAFGMKVVYSARSHGVSKQELVQVADVISIHSPLNDQTRHAFGEREFAAMKRGAIIVNTARGPVIDEAALVRALERGGLGGAGLDVYEDEPRVHPGLIARDDVVLLPHVGSATHDTRRRMAELALGDAVRVLRGERPLHPVNTPRQ